MLLKLNRLHLALSSLTGKLPLSFVNLTRYSDTGASNHITFDFTNLTIHDIYHGKDQVTMQVWILVILAMLQLLMSPLLFIWTIYYIFLLLLLIFYQFISSVMIIIVILSSFLIDSIWRIKRRGWRFSVGERTWSPPFPLSLTDYNQIWLSIYFSLCLCRRSSLAFSTRSSCVQYTVASCFK